MNKPKITEKQVEDMAEKAKHVSIHEKIIYNDYPYIKKTSIDSFNHLVDLGNKSSEEMRVIQEYNNKNLQYIKNQFKFIANLISILITMSIFIIMYKLVPNIWIYLFIWVSIALYGYAYDKLMDAHVSKNYKRMYLDQEYDRAQSVVMADEALKVYIEKFQKEKRKLQNHWNSLNGWDFEYEVAELFKTKGYKAYTTQGSGDGGVDIYLTKDDKETIVQCKNHSGKVGPHVARDLYGALISNNAEKAILVSSNGFTKGVFDFVEGKPIELMTTDDLLKMSN